MGTAPDPIKRLVDRFDQQSDHIRSPDYNETLIRIDFINPLMSELGWDMDNRAGYAEQYREVVHEDRVKVAGQTKAPDYSLRIGGQRKFSLEANKPAVNIRDKWEPAYQLRRYAWSAKLACSIRTDFEEFRNQDKGKGTQCPRITLTCSQSRRTRPSFARPERSRGFANHRRVWPSASRQATS